MYWTLFLTFVKIGMFIHRRWLLPVAAYPAGCGGPGVDDERGLYRRFLRGPNRCRVFRREYSDLRGL